MLQPEMPEAIKTVAPISSDIKDVLTYVLFPMTGLRFLKWKYGLETPPEEVKPTTLEDVKKEDEIVKKALSGELSDKPKVEKTEFMREFNVFVNESPYKVLVEEVGGTPVITSVRRAVPPVRQEPKPEVKKETPKPAAKPAPKVEEKKVAPTPVVQAKAEAGDIEIKAPMPGLLVRYEKKVGDEVKKDEPVATIEAMKMQMAVNATESGVIKALNFSAGSSVEKDAVLAIITAK
jgi:biotin carboxyl carrier protein